MLVCLFVCFSRQSPWLGSDHRFYLVFCGFDFGSVFKVFAKLLWVSPARMQFRDEPGSSTASYTEVEGSPSPALSSPGFPTHGFSQRPLPSKSSSKKNGVSLGVFVTTLLHAVLYWGHPWGKARSHKRQIEMGFPPHSLNHRGRFSQGPEIWWLS